MSHTLDRPISFDNLDSFDYAPRRGATGLDLAPARPAVCANPARTITGYADAQARILRASNAAHAVADDLRDAKLKLAGIDAERDELTRRVQSGHMLTAGEAARVNIERTAALANIDLITDATARAKADLDAARANMKAVLRYAARDFLTLLRRQEADADAEARATRNKHNAYATWSRDVSAALQHDLDTDDLHRLLGIGVS